MDLTAGTGWIVAAAFGIGALHALEPGHGKSIMGAYLVASRGGVRHALLLGLVVTVTHTVIVFLLALGVLMLADRFATEQVSLWLEIVSGVLVLSVGLWMMATTFDLLRRSRGHDHGRGDPGASEHAHHAHDDQHSHDHEHHHGPGSHPHDHVHGPPHVHSHQHDRPPPAHFSHHGHAHEVRIPQGKNPLGIWTLVAVGASGGLVPCPAALTGLLAAVNLGRPATGIAVVGAMSLGIAATLMAIGILFVQAGRWASHMFGSRVLHTHVPRASAVLIIVLGLVLLGRTVLEHGH